MPGYSLAIIQYSEENGFEFLLSKPYRSGSYVSGLQKLAQNFLVELMTQKGSVRFEPDFGSRLPSELRGMNILSLNDLHGSLARSLNDVVMNIRSRERMTDTPDELLADVSIIDLRQMLDRVIVSLRLRSESGTDLVMKLPLELTEAV